MRKIAFVIISLLVFSSSAFSKDTSIKIHFPGAQGRTALLWTMKDYISNQEINIKETKIDAQGNFEFVLDIKKVSYYRIQVEFLRFNLYVQAGENLDIEVEAVDFKNRDLYPKNAVIYLSPKLHYKKPNINTQLLEVSNHFADFLDTNWAPIYQHRLPKSIMENFNASMDSIALNSPYAFIKEHINIQQSQLKLLQRNVNDAWMVQEFFMDDKIQYDNKVYMDFFSSYWSKYLLVSIKGLRYGELDSVINHGKSYYALSRLIEKDTILKQPAMRELVVLCNLKRMYANRRFSKRALMDIMSDISANGVNGYNKKIARNLRLELLNFDDNSQDFVLPDFEQDSYDLKNSKGKYVYINFWTEACDDCISEMDVCKELVFDLDDVIDFVSIYVGPDTAKAAKLIQARDYKWKMLYFDHQFDLLKKYNVELLPRYILIDKKGNLEMPKAYLPSEGFKDYFIEMLNKKKGNLD